MTLPASFLAAPITHRGLHDIANGRRENSMASFQAAIDAGYGIEMDIQASSDGVPMVFHDYDLGRLTHQTGPVAGRSAEALTQIGLRDDPGTIPTFVEMLELVAGRVPLLIEVKDQDGAMGPDIGPLGAGIARALKGYDGDAALMSFNPHHVAEFAKRLPDVPRGLVTDPYLADDWPTVPAATRDRLRNIPDYDAVGATFISHNRRDLHAPRVAELRKAEAAILCWTIRSPQEEAEARKVAHNVTFEGYLA